MNPQPIQSTKIVLDTKLNQSIFPTVDYLTALSVKAGEKIVYHSGSDRLLIPIPEEQCQPNLLLQALDEAFSKHRPIKITPDLLWMLVIQGVSQHINLNPEKHRSSLVKHKEKKVVTVRKDALLTDPSKWEEVPEDLIKKFRKDLVDESILEALIPTYSTSTEVEKNAFRIGVMDVFSSFFEYWVMTLCGIPEIILEGDEEDWSKFKNNLKELEVYELGWWVKSLYPVLDKIIETVNGTIDKAFWKSIYKLNEFSGGPYISGWIIKFFPYLKSIVSDSESNSFFEKEEVLKREKTEVRDFIRISGRNPFLYAEEVPQCLKMDNFHVGISKVDFNWQRLSETVEMEFVSGIVGISQDEKSYTLCPEIGWCVREK